MLINQETGKVHQFARQALRWKNAISEPTYTEMSPCPLRFLHSPDVYLVSAVLELGPGRTRAVRARSSGVPLPNTSGRVALFH